jgi:hypothetical protein
MPQARTGPESRAEALKGLHGDADSGLSEPSNAVDKPMTEPGLRVCSRCGEPAEAQRFCASCGLNLAAQPELPTRAEWESQRSSGLPSSGTAGAAPDPNPARPAGVGSWRDLAAQAREKASPYLDAALDSAVRARDRRMGERVAADGSSTPPPASGAAPPSGSGPSDAQPENHSAAARPDPSERVGRAIGKTGGYATRSLVGVASAPVVKTVWTDRPNIPTWQKVIGAVAWPLMALTPHGWLFLGGSFFVMVILGRSSPYEWATWITKWASVFLVVTVIVVVVIVLAIIAGNNPSGAAVISLSSV